MLKEKVKELKKKGIETALIKPDGTAFYSTFKPEENIDKILYYLNNNAHNLMEEIGEKVGEIEIFFGKKTLFIKEIRSYVFVAIYEKEEEKTDILELADLMENAIKSKER